MSQCSEPEYANQSSSPPWHLFWHSTHAATRQPSDWASEEVNITLSGQLPVKGTIHQRTSEMAPLYEKVFDNKLFSHPPLPGKQLAVLVRNVTRNCRVLVQTNWQPFIRRQLFGLRFVVDPDYHFWLAHNFPFITTTTLRLVPIITMHHHVLEISYAPSKMSTLNSRKKY